MKVKRKTSIQNVIPVSSMSDIAFLLLIFLMLSSILNMKQGPKIQTPQAKEISTPKEAQKYELIVDKNGSYFFEGNYVTLDSLTTVFSERILIYPDLFVEINGDISTEYQYIDSAVKALQDAKCYRVLFICEKLKKENPS